MSDAKGLKIDCYSLNDAAFEMVLENISDIQYEIKIVTQVQNAHEQLIALRDGAVI